MENRTVKVLEGLFSSSAEIALAFIFGSAAGSRLTKDSDIDIAVLFEHKPDVAGILAIKSAATEVVGRPVDIVVLNDSSPVIRMQVLKNGILIRKSGDASYNDFYVRTVKEYDDLKRIRKEAEENILKGGIYA